jgi:hypothetical protein
MRPTDLHFRAPQDTIVGMLDVSSKQSSREHVAIGKAIRFSKHEESLQKQTGQSNLVSPSRYNATEAFLRLH